MSYLKEHIVEVKKRNSDDTKQKLWKGASKELCNEGYKYTPENCRVKWKNIKQNFLKWDIRNHKVNQFFFLKNKGFVNFDKLIVQCGKIKEI